jgi:hypothetical protein
VMMYLSPLLDKVVKPSKPVANFAVDQDHPTRTVVFHNRSFSRADGFWDFGDGSPLEPVNPDQESVTHVYAEAGVFVAKLTLRNLFNEESERSVTIKFEDEKPPTIKSLEIVPISPGNYAPAAFHVHYKVENAGLCLLDQDDDREMNIVREGLADRDQFVTFDKPGKYTIKLAAINGDTIVQQKETIEVLEPPAGMVSAVVHVSEQFKRTVQQPPREVTVADTFAAPQGQTQPFRKEIKAKPGSTIVEAELVDAAKIKGARGVRVQVIEKGKSAVVMGELVRNPAAAPQQPVPIKVNITEEKQVNVSNPPVPISVPLTLPGVAVLALPPKSSNVVGLQRNYRLELRDGDKPIWQDSRLPLSAPVVIQGKHCLLSTAQDGDQIRITVTDQPTAPPAAN